MSGTFMLYGLVLRAAQTPESPARLLGTRGWLAMAPQEPLAKWPRQDLVLCIYIVLQCLLHMPHFEFAVHTAESIAMACNSSANWGMCSKHCNTMVAK